ncbi:MAG: hypothetical protein KAR31_07500, partial [Candidatus Omnitrophica bacterium]|nr:hypothetical protein [Candidatus Omnitrophota bacterium]
LITDSAINTSPTDDSITIYKSDGTTGLTVGDGFTIIDRVYAREGSGGANLYMTKDGTAAYPVTWNTSGTVVLDIVNHSPGLYLYGDHITVDGFIVTDDNESSGIYVRYGGNNDNRIMNNSLFNCRIMADTNYSVIEGNYLWLRKYKAGATAIFSYSGNGNGINNIIRNNEIFYNDSYVDSGNAIWGGRPNNTVVGNKVFGGVRGIVFWWGSSYDNEVIKNNIIMESYSTGILTGGAGTNVSNNTIVHVGSRNTGGDGVVIYESLTNRRVYNNIIYDMNDAGRNAASGTTYDFNYFYSNGEDVEDGGTIGANSITGTDPGFAAEDTGTANTGSSTTMIISTEAQAWTANEWVGAAVEITSGTGSGQWAGIASNSAERLFVAPAFVTEPDNTSTFEITNFYIDDTTSVTTPLGQGCAADGSTTDIGVNMGARLGYVVNDDQANDDIKFNWIQAAEDGVNLDSGDTVTIYARDEGTGTVSGTPTDNGPTITFNLSETNVITSDDQYEGMYAYMSSWGTPDYYMIVDSVDDTTDTITLLVDSTTDFSASDTFSIVDRVYKERSHASANFSMNTSGTTGWVTWDVSNTVITDAEDEKDYNVYAETGLDKARLSDSIKLFNHTEASGLGGQAITNQADGYYKWGDADIPTIISIILNPVSPVKAEQVTFTITFSETMDNGVSPTVTFGIDSPYNARTITQDSYSGDTWVGNFTVTSGYDGTQHISVSGAKDTTGNTMAADTVHTFVIDTDVPGITGITTTDTNSDGAVETATIVFDEPVDDSTFLAGDFTIGGQTVTSIDTGGTADDNTFDIILSTGVSTTGALIVTYTQGTGADLAGNLLANVSQTSTDGAGPVILACYGTVASADVTVYFSEGVYNAISAPASPTGDLALSDFGITDTDNSRTISGVSHTAGSNTAILTLSAALDATDDLDVDTINAAVTAIYDSADNTAENTINRTITGSLPTYTWDNTSTDGLWSTAANWVGDAVPLPGAVVVFNSTYNTNCTANIVADNLVSITLDTGYTATLTLEANFVAGAGVLNLTGTGDALKVVDGTILCEGDATAVNSDSGGTTDVPHGTGITINVANGDVNIGTDGTIKADGEGFGGSEGPGEGEDAIWASGAGYGGMGGNSGTGVQGGLTYGSATQPGALGSGGGTDTTEGTQGGTGGGAIKINATGTVTVSGTISANGGNYSGTQAGGGSGGSLWIIADTLAGSGGSIIANGGNGHADYSGGGGGGRIKLEWTTEKTFSGTISAAAGNGWQDSGHAGTFSFPDNEDLTVNYDIALAYGTYNIPTLHVTNNATLECQGDPDDGTNGSGVIINATTVTVDNGAKISADKLGFSEGEGPGAGGDAVYAGGAGYGGSGGDGASSDDQSGSTYGSATQPTALGSGGGDDTNDTEKGGAGGGAIKINATETVTISGTISADGGNYAGHQPGGGSGGSIWVIADTLAGAGSITANGGNGHTDYSGGGGGGRIAFYFSSYNNTLTSVTVASGTGYEAGDPGTLVWTPIGGYENENVLAAAQCSQSSNGDGVVTVTFKVKDPGDKINEEYVYNVGDTQVYDGANGWAAVGGDAGIQTNMYFNDADSSLAYDSGEDIWLDDVTANEEYDTGETQAYDGGDGWSTSAATAGIQGNIYFSDVATANSAYDTGEDIWAEISGDNTNHTLKTFEYSVNGGGDWAAPANGDATGYSLAGGWPDNSTASYIGAPAFGNATAYNFTWNTQHADLAGLNNDEQADVQIRFLVKDTITQGAETWYLDSQSSAVSADFIVDNLAPSISSVLIMNSTMSIATHVKDTDNVTITAGVSDANLSNGDTAYITANLTGFGGVAAANPDTYDGTTATWNLTDVACTPSDGAVTVTVDADDPAGNAAGQGSDDITADNTVPGISTITTKDTDNDGTTETVTIVFEEPVEDTTFNAADFNIGGFDGNNIVTGTPDDGTFDVTLTTGANGTEAKDVIYTQGAGADIAGNLLANVISDDITEIDGAKPVLIAVYMVDAGTGGVFTEAGDRMDLVFSETLNALPTEVQLEAALTFAGGTTDGDNIPDNIETVGTYTLATTTFTNDTIRIISAAGTDVTTDPSTPGTTTVQVVDGTNIKDNATTPNEANTDAAAETSIGIVGGEISLHIGDNRVNVTLTGMSGSQDAWVMQLVAADISGIRVGDCLSDEADPAVRWRITAVDDGADTVTVDYKLPGQFVWVSDSTGPDFTGATQAFVGAWYTSLSSWESDRDGNITATGRNT